MNTPNPVLRLLAPLLGAVFASHLAAQIVPPVTAAKEADAKSESAVVLSPFEVRAEDDVGYQAGNTTSGSRLNSSLKDTAASVSVFTPEFISDIAANNISEMLAYATNVESEVEDSNQGFNNPTMRTSDGTTGDFRVRGIAGSFAVDLMETAVAQDNYNIERVELSSGPNSVLFGLGSAGGLVTLTTKRANVQRNKYTFKGQFGEWHLQRYEADLNYVLVPKKLAVRAQGLDSSREGFRHWDFEDIRRGTVELTSKPWTNTTVRGAFERGQYHRHVTWPWNGGDQISVWRAAGSVVKDTFVAATDTPLGLASFGTNNRFTISESDNTLYNFRNKLQSAGLGLNQAGSLLQASDMPMNYSFNGPGAHFDQSFRNYQGAIEQRLTQDIVVEAAYLHTDSAAFATSWAVPNNMIDLRADPNLTLPDPRDPARTIPNPNAGKLYMEGNWRPDSTNSKNDVARATVALGHDFGKWGLHRLTGLFETAKAIRQRRSRVEILVDDNNVPLSNAATPENTQNQLFRRHYVTLNDFTTYYQGNPSLPVPALPVTVTSGSTTVVKNAHYATVPVSADSNADSNKQTDTLMFALQDYWWNKRLVTTFGYRVDDIVFKSGMTARLPATDPRVVSQQRVSGEWEPTGRFDRNAYQPVTHTEGAVFHLNDRFSFFYNQSSNVGAPRFDRTVLPGVLPEPTEGKGRDGGLMIDFTRDGRYYLRATYYKTVFLRDTPIIPGGVGGGNFFTTAVANILDNLQSQGQITAAERDAHVTFFTAFMVDVVSAGEELEFVANPNRHWTVRLTYAHTQRNRANYFTEREPYLSDFKTFALAKDNGAIITATGRTVTQELANLDQLIADNDDLQVQSYGTRPHKANLTSRYAFSEGRLKGLFVGGAYRWQSQNYTQMDLRVGVPTYGQKFYGQAIQAFDFFSGYNTRLPWLKTRATFQLNVKNAFNQSRVTVGRYNTDFSGIRRVYLQEPRSWRLTTTVDF